jgi:hypothetical protein
MKLARNALIALLSLSLTCAPVWAAREAGNVQEPAQESSQEAPQFEEKFLWGLLIKYALTSLAEHAFSLFAKWLINKMTGGLDVGSLISKDAPMLQVSGATIGQAAPPPQAAPAAVVVGEPGAPLKVEDGRENYQGMHVALAVLQPDGRMLGFRPVSEGFRTGERFKLRIVSTFDGELLLENINPRSERRQIYPAVAGQVVKLRQGKETFLPLGANDFFEFAGSAGQEQLVVSLRDPRAVGVAASARTVHRRDEGYGSNLIQETPPGTFPYLSQAIALSHVRQPAQLK